ncbi:CRP/FNR family transcriptional regulator, anaerobic regulatory protein [Oscillibacter sp. PC13]|uniref:Crp/Fnr family transcriptional regulator n=1 Tax=Oscillibacter sp. PC13 TaxID=1855299 RepID=UPI0008EE9D8C|nr:Crp/Fnr family transcriptional regulator [Oscillibacter sp. PC13]SFP85329.1 CRP/FNR family transcriptional regulator, anaerobic regulatory protein [Oscillibacter sp. PC13]
MDLKDYFPVWDRLTVPQQEILSQSVVRRMFSKGAIIHSGEADCIGILLVRSGQLRAYNLSSEGRELTISRLFERDICLFSAACMMNSFQCDVFISAEKDSEVWAIPPRVYKAVMEQSAPLANYTNELMASRFSDVMWVMEQVMWKRQDQRVAAFLLEEAAIEGTDQLKITHENIANHLGAHREVVTRMLRYFQSEGMVKLTRGGIEIVNPGKLRELSE